MTAPKGHIEGTPAGSTTAEVDPQRCDLGKLGGDDGNRTHDPLLAKQDQPIPSPAADR